MTHADTIACLITVLLVELLTAWQFHLAVLPL